MPNSRHISVIGSPSRSRATKRRRSSIAELSFHGIHTSRSKKAKSVTHVSGTKCHLCLRPLSSVKSGFPGQALGKHYSLTVRTQGLQLQNPVSGKLSSFARHVS